MRGRRSGTGLLGIGVCWLLAACSGQAPEDSGTNLTAIVGAYFGVKVGSAGRAEAEAARNAEAVKVQELAATVDPKTAQDALDRAAERLQSPGGAVAGVPRAGV